MGRLERLSLSEALETWKFEEDEVILDHIRYWILKATQLGLTTFSITLNCQTGTYFCKAGK